MIIAARLQESSVGRAAKLTLSELRHHEKLDVFSIRTRLIFESDGK